MAFDLTITSVRDARVRKRVLKLANRYACETWGDDTLGVGIGHLTDAEARKLYASLVRLAKKEALTLHDPQAGIAIDLSRPGTAPPGWSPPEPVDERAFYAAVHKRLFPSLERLGYARSQFGFERVLGEELGHRIGFRSNEGRCMAFIDWVFLVEGGVVPQWPAPIRLVDYVVGSEIGDTWPVPQREPQWGWLPASKDALPTSLALLERGVLEVVHPFLDSVASVAKLVEAVESGRLEGAVHNIKERAPHPVIELAFGYGGHTLRNMAAAYRHVGRLAEGRRRADAYIPEGEDDFIMQMRDQVATLFSE